MGSHGGGTAEGQAAVLAACGITPESMGVPVIGEMDTEAVAVHPGGLTLFCFQSSACRGLPGADQPDQAAHEVQSGNCLRTV
ncbi:MAG: hypothetical protein R2875_06300 [Desulfobacterales bacterium]